MRSYLTARLALCGAIVSAQTVSQFELIPAYDFEFLYVRGVDDVGRVVGTGIGPGDGGWAFLFDGQAIRILPGPQGAISTDAFAINDSGRVVGSYWPPSGGARAAYWDNGVLTPITALADTPSYAYAVNSLGQITGSFLSPGGPGHAFLWDGNSIRDLGSLDGGSSSAFALNDLGHVTGESYTGYSDTNAFLWDGTTMTALGPYAGVRSVGMAINNRDQIAGYVDVNDLGAHAWVWDHGFQVDLNQPSWAESTASAINNHGHILLSASETLNGNPGAYLLTRGQMLALAPLLAPYIPAGFELDIPRFMADTGWIAGRAEDSDYNTYIYRFRVQPTLVGRVNLASFQTDNPDLTLSLRFGGSGYRVITDLSGDYRYSVMFPDWGTAAIVAKVSHWLSVKRTVDLDSEMAVNWDFPFNGDLNQDNSIGIADLAMVLADFGSSYVTDDVDGDGKMTFRDLSIVLANFGLHGEE